MSNERKILYMSVAVNFTLGVILGIILFNGQIKTTSSIGDMYDYDMTISFTDFFRIAWMNLLWMISILVARSILRARLIHPVITLRGLVNSFSFSYMLNFFGIKESLCAFLPQCLSVLPLLLIFSVETVLRMSSRLNEGNAIIVKKSEIFLVLFLSMFSSGAELMFFKLFCACLF